MISWSEPAADQTGAEQLPLTDQQLGHLRHFDNLSRLAPNDWSLMQSLAPHQDDFTGYRFQLAYMVYAAALSHRNRLPAAPGRFQPMIERLVNKLLEPEVWLYWRDTSRGGGWFNAHLADSYSEEWDPVIKDNIMYSAYVQSTALLHDYLFRRDSFAEPGTLTFRFWSMFWGGDEKSFAYDRDSLNEQLYWQMVRNGYIGVACEPNCVFQICNQPAILGFRMHDLITGGSRTAEILAGYEQAWADFGRLDAAGHYNMMVFEDSQAVVPNAEPMPWVDAWCGTMMHMWNREFVREHYAEQVAAFLAPQPDGTVAVKPSSREFNGRPTPYKNADLGWVATWASEVGDTQTLDGLLEYADCHMNPTVRNGGLYYPRRDAIYDETGRYVEMDPLSGNALLAYARLNVEGGLWTLFNEPWSDRHFSEPALTQVAFDVDVSRAAVTDGVLRTRLQRRDDMTGDGTVDVERVLHHGDWRCELDRTEIATVQDGQIAAAPGTPTPIITLDDMGGVLRLRCQDHEPHDLTFAPVR